MEMNLTREVVKFLLLGIAYWAYMISAAQVINEESALLVNGFIVPFVVGSIGYLSFRSQKMARVILATSVSLLAALVASEGGDPAKPGVHLVVIAVMTAISFLGAVTTAGAAVAVQTLRTRQKKLKI